MSETINLEFIGATLRAIQAEQRTLRGENELIRKEMGRMSAGISFDFGVNARPTGVS